ncbi:MAG: AAA family ATPase [Syntrophaceae bacterium]|nr:AAA family ATPase [Syntrophaceae bacterium]
MARKIVSTGRGGAGKSTFVALMSRYLPPPSLFVDLDPDLSLAEMLGIDLAKEGKRTVVEALYDAVKERQRGGSPLTPVEDRFKGLMWGDCLYEGRGFDVITLGTKDLEGCYCYPDHLLRKTISELSKNYKNVVIDSPAGLEHLNRNIVSQVDDLFVVLDPSDKSLIHIQKVKAILKEVGTMYDHFYLVANYMFDEEAEKYFTEAGEFYLGKIEYDQKVEEYNLKGEPLNKLPEDSPACRSVRKILEKAGVI